MPPTRRRIRNDDPLDRKLRCMIEREEWSTSITLREKCKAILGMTSEVPTPTQRLAPIPIQEKLELATQGGSI